MKKLEIIIESFELNKVIREIDECNISGYSVISDITGRGRHGNKVSAILVDVIRYEMIIIVEEESKIEAVIKRVKPMIERYSGIMFLTDAEVIH